MQKQEESYLSNHKKYGGYSPEIFKLTPAGSDVLDVGCTTGSLARALKTKDCKVVGLDIDPNSLKLAQKHCSKTVLCDLDHFAKDCKDLPISFFDAVTMGDVLEHLKFPSNLLRDIKPLLKQGGSIIASIPNAAFISNRLNFLRGNFKYSETGGLMDYDHLRFFSMDTAKHLFQSCGYKIKKIYGVSIVRDRFWFLRLLAKFSPRIFAVHIIIEAQKIK